MAYVFTRQQLYELVWSGPIPTLAKSLSISDVGLAKACRRGDIPLPPRGHWARPNAGKRVIRPALPRRAPGATGTLRGLRGCPALLECRSKPVPWHLC